MSEKNHNPETLSEDRCRAKGSAWEARDNYGRYGELRPIGNYRLRGYYGGYGELRACGEVQGLRLCTGATGLQARATTEALRGGRCSILQLSTLPRGTAIEVPEAGGGGSGAGNAGKPNNAKDRRNSKPKTQQQPK